LFQLALLLSRSGLLELGTIKAHIMNNRDLIPEDIQFLLEELEIEKDTKSLVDLKSSYSRLLNTDYVDDIKKQISHNISRTQAIVNAIDEILKSLNNENVTI